MVWTLGFDPWGGANALGKEAVFTRCVSDGSCKTSGTGADPGTMSFGRFGCSTAGAGVPVLSTGSGTASFSTKYLSAWRASSGRSDGRRLTCHMIQSQAQRGMPSRNS